MKLWLISQSVNDGYDTYDACVVAAETEEEARRVSPSPFIDAWAPLKDIEVELLGDATEGHSGLILGSFNAG